MPTDHRRGAPHPLVTVIEYGDYESIACRAAESALATILAAHPRAVQLIFRHYPLEREHPHALIAAEASEAAAAQGAFWPMHDALMRTDARRDRLSIDRMALALGLDAARFGAALNEGIYRQRIREQEQGAVASHVRESPGFFVNGVVCDVSGGMHHLLSAVEARL